MFIDRFLRQVQKTPDNPACLFLKGPRSVATANTYRELHEYASNLARQLHSRNLAQRPVGLMFGNDLHFVASLLACFYVNAAAVPIPNSIFGYAKQRAKSILAHIELDALLVAAGNTPTLADDCNTKNIIAVDPLNGSEKFGFIPIKRDPDDIALIQYTSGSVTAPKGVLISHRNLWSNQQMIQEAFHHQNGNCVTVNWLPFYHDMGLVGGLLQALFVGGYCVQIRPIDFLKNPLIWLQAISDYRANSSGAPSFGFSLCVDSMTRRQVKADFDFSAWKVAYCGAEPISEKVFLRFAERFAGHGFQSASFFPCYGMAEATLIITAADYQSGYKVHHHKIPFTGKTETVVSCGKALGDQSIKIRSDSGADLVDGEVGEIYLSGSNLFRGYLSADEVLRNFQMIDGRRYFATGDLGFLHERELYITGRKKDLIILNGVNFYPHDIAWFVGTLDTALDPLSGSAFEFEDPNQPQSKSVVHLHELKRGIVLSQTDTAQIRKRIGIRLTQEYGFQVKEVILLKSGGLPRTASGKIQHRKCRDLYSAGPSAPIADLQKA